MLGFIKYHFDAGHYMKELYWTAGLCLLATTLLTAQEAGKDHSPQSFTGHPPVLYMQVFIACPSDAPCTKTDGFRVDARSNGCCILTVTNGDGRGTDEVRHYEVFFNGERVASADDSPSAGRTVKVLRRNKLRVILTGKPHSKIWVQIVYDPRQPS